MKRLLQMAALALLVMLGGSWRNTASAQPGYDDGISYQQFYDELSPHGRWIEYPEYGYVWAPTGISGFRPYETGGRWVWTDDYQWMWVSDYSWGWAPFHYGRWFHDPFYGWMWVPGYEWAPAWVAWRDGGDYYGWAPIRPGFNISISIGFGSYNPPVDYWCFAPRRYITSPHIYNYCVDRGRNVTIINNTTIINNYSRRNNVFINGPRRADAERYAGRIQPTRFRDASSPGRPHIRNNEVSVYRPRVRQDNDRQFRPGNVTRYEGKGNNNVGRNDGNATRRNVFDRSNNNSRRENNGDIRRPSDGRNAEVRPRSNNDETRRRNVFDRGNNNNDPQRQQPVDNNRQAQRPPGQRNNEVRPQRNQPQTQPQRQERQRNVFDRRSNGGGSQPNREIRTQRQPSPQVDRPQQQRPQRQLGNGNNGGGGREQRGNNNGNGNRRNVFDRRGG